MRGATSIRRGIRRKTAAEVQGLLDGVASASSSSGDADSVRALLAHARLLLDLLPATDRALKSLRAVREDQDHEPCQAGGRGDGQEFAPGDALPRRGTAARTCGHAARLDSRRIRSSSAMG